MLRSLDMSGRLTIRGRIAGLAVLSVVSVALMGSAALWGINAFERAVGQDRDYAALDDATGEVRTTLAALRGAYMELGAARNGALVDRYDAAYKAARAKLQHLVAEPRAEEVSEDVKALTALVDQLGTLFQPLKASYTKLGLGPADGLNAALASARGAIDAPFEQRP